MKNTNENKQKSTRITDSFFNNVKSNAAKINKCLQSAKFDKVSDIADVCDTTKARVYSHMNYLTNKKNFRLERLKKNNCFTNVKQKLSFCMVSEGSRVNNRIMYKKLGRILPQNRLNSSEECQKQRDRQTER